MTAVPVTNSMFESDMRRIKINKIRCNKCGDEIESTYRHDFVFCKCGACAVDGGHDYLRRGGNREDWTDLSEYEDAPSNVPD